MADLSHMFSTYVGRVTLNQDLLAASVEEILRCSVTCAVCADVCIAEDNVADLRACIRTDLDCSDVCAATARVLTRQTAPDPLVLRSQLKACAEICERCAEECESHAEHMDHCRICAETCRKCSDTCNKLLAKIGSATYA